MPRGAAAQASVELNPSGSDEGWIFNRCQAFERGGRAGVSGRKRGRSWCRSGASGAQRRAGGAPGVGKMRRRERWGTEVMVKLVVTSVLVLSLASLPAATGLACSSITLPPLIAKLEPGEVALDGAVTGYVSSDSVLPVGNSANGLVVEVADVVYGSLPDLVVAIFPLALDTACNPISNQKADLEQQYPIGSQVSVIGELSSARLRSSGNVRFISATPDAFAYISKRPADPPMAPDGVLDFRAFSKRYEEQPAVGFSLSLAWRNAHRAWFEDFEYFRALQTLGGLKPKSSRVALARRLRYYHGFRDVRRDLAVKRYSRFLKLNNVPHAARGDLLNEFKRLWSAP